MLSGSDVSRSAGPSYTAAAPAPAGIAGLHRAAEDDGTFCYTFFKAEARR